MIVYAAGSGLMLPLLNAAALKPFPHIAGTASASSMMVFTAASGLGTVAAGLIEPVSPVAFAIVMVLAQCLSVASHHAFAPRKVKLAAVVSREFRLSSTPRHRSRAWDFERRVAALDALTEGVTRIKPRISAAMRFASSSRPRCA